MSRRTALARPFPGYRPVCPPLGRPIDRPIR
jgi:hypothetical protein